MSANTENSTNEDTQGQTSEDIARRSTLAGTVVLIGLIVVAFLAYTIHNRDMLAEQARNFGKIFIESSPAVEKQLGEVRSVKEVEEQHRTGNARGWYLDYDVTGSARPEWLICG